MEIGAIGASSISSRNPMKNINNIAGSCLFSSHRKKFLPRYICINYAIKMDQKCARFYPNAPLENDDLEQRLEMKINDVKSFINHINNI